MDVGRRLLATHKRAPPPPKEAKLPPGVQRAYKKTVGGLGDYDIKTHSSNLNRANVEAGTCIYAKNCAACTVLNCPPCDSLCSGTFTCACFGAVAIAVVHPAA